MDKILFYLGKCGKVSWVCLLYYEQKQKLLPKSDQVQFQESGSGAQLKKTNDNMHMYNNNNT